MAYNGNMRYYKLNLWFAYFNKGFSFMAYPKYALFLIGAGDVIASEGDYTNVIIAAFIIFFGCLFGGRWAYKHGWVAAEHEVQNRVDPFVRQMREKLINNKAL